MSVPWLREPWARLPHPAVAATQGDLLKDLLLPSVSLQVSELVSSLSFREHSRISHLHQAFFELLQAT